MAVTTSVVGEYKLVIELTAPGLIESYWLNPNGKKIKTPPKHLGDKHKSAYIEAKNKLKSIRSTLSSQRQRLENFFVQAPKFDFSEWWESFVNQPLLYCLAENLIWQFETNGGKDFTAILVDKKLVSSDGIEQAIPSKKTKVSLLHTIHATLSDICSWRNFFDSQQLKQPFPQLERETYSKNTGKLFQEELAGLFVRQHQFNALLRNKNWSYTLQGGFEADSEAILELPRCISMHLPIINQSTLSSRNGIAIAVELGEIYFQKNNKLISHNPISDQLYSEVMRDIDLITSVTGLGYEEDWAFIEDAFKLQRIKEGRTIPTSGDICDLLYWLVQEFEIERFNPIFQSKQATSFVRQSLEKRKLMLNLMLRNYGFGENFYFENNFIFITTPSRKYKINIQNGVAFECATQKLIKPLPKKLVNQRESSSDTLFNQIYYTAIKLYKK